MKYLIVALMVLMLNACGYDDSVSSFDGSIKETEIMALSFESNDVKGITLSTDLSDITLTYYDLPNEDKFIVIRAEGMNIRGALVEFEQTENLEELNSLLLSMDKVFSEETVEGIAYSKILDDDSISVTFVELIESNKLRDLYHVGIFISRTIIDDKFVLEEFSTEIDVYEITTMQTMSEAVLEKLDLIITDEGIKLSPQAEAIGVMFGLKAGDEITTLNGWSAAEVMQDPELMMDLYRSSGDVKLEFISSDGSVREFKVPKAW